MEVKLLITSHHTRWCNCYGIRTEKAAIIIDPGKFTEELADFLSGDREKMIFLTHGHYDHMLGAEELRKKTGSKIACDERCFFREPGRIVMPASKYYSSDKFDLKIDVPFKSDCDITVGDVTVKCLHTPGHYFGEASYLIGNNLFSGDTLFFETIGVTKYPTGSKEDMMGSLEKLKKLDRNVMVYPGHGKSTDIGHELKFNPFMRDKNVDLQSMR